MPPRRRGHAPPPAGPPAGVKAEIARASSEPHITLDEVVSQLNSSSAAGTVLRIAFVTGNKLHLSLPLSASDSGRIRDEVEGLLAGGSSIAPVVVRRPGAAAGSFIVRHYVSFPDGGFVRLSPGAARWANNTDASTGMPLPDEPGVTFD